MNRESQKQKNVFMNCVMKAAAAAATADVFTILLVYLVVVLTAAE
jgi:hypothetical protein